MEQENFNVKMSVVCALINAYIVVMCCGVFLRKTSQIPQNIVK